MKKRITIIIMLLALGFACAAGNGKRDRADGGVRASGLSSLISEYGGRDGFEVVRIGRVGTSLIRSLARLGGDSDEWKELQGVIGGIRKIAVVDYGCCSQSDRQGFERKLGRLLKDEGMIMEVRDGGDICRLYGVVDDSSGVLSDFVMHIPNDGALICLFGTMSLDKVISAIGQ